MKPTARHSSVENAVRIVEPPDQRCPWPGPRRRAPADRPPIPYRRWEYIRLFGESNRVGVRSAERGTKKSLLPSLRVPRSALPLTPPPSRLQSPFTDPRG